MAFLYKKLFMNGIPVQKKNCSGIVFLLGNTLSEKNYETLCFCKAT